MSPLFRWSRRLTIQTRSVRHHSKTSNESRQNVMIWDEVIEPKGQKVPLTSRHPNFLTWYACGPTVYDWAHIGHASSYIRLDIIRRILERQGYTVLQVMGVTDIDDKIIQRAQVMNVPWYQLAQTYELEFFQDLDRMNVKTPDIKARVSQFIPQIRTFVSDLIASKFAYATPDGSVYFERNKYAKPGMFRQSNIAESTEDDEKPGIISPKRNRTDFALWKGVKPGEPYWETPWGKGRPGWHIECSVIASHFFGPFLDVHSGGMDLTFPHHENEEVQCCAKFGHEKWVSHWIHTGHLHLTGDVKMSKSIGNTVAVNRFLEKNSPEVLRMLCLMKKYFTNIEYNLETELHAKSLLHKLNTFISDSKAIVLGTKIVRLKAGSNEADLWNKLIVANDTINKALLNNFDTPTAVLTLMDLVGEFYRRVEMESDDLKMYNGLDLSLVLANLNMVQDFFSLVGLSQPGKKASSSDSSDVLLEPLLNETVEFRSVVRSIALNRIGEKGDLTNVNTQHKKELMKACDQFRKNLGTLGIDIKDHAQASSWSFSDKLISSQNR